jgi:hypothetical protein
MERGCVEAGKGNAIKVRGKPKRRWKEDVLKLARAMLLR